MARQRSRRWHDVVGGKMMAAQIAQTLAANVEKLVRELLPAGRREGAEWRAGSIHNNAGRSLGIHLYGQKAGIWSDFATGQKGDALDLVAAVRFCGDRRQAMKWASAWLGLSSNAHPRRAIEMPDAGLPAAARSQGITDSRARRIEAARRIWTKTTDLRGTVAELYLQTRRLRTPEGSAIRFHPRCPRRIEAGTELLPAMVAEIVDPLTGTFVGVHRTFLLPDGSGKVPVQPRMMLGRAGVVRLADDEQVTLGLGLTEGIENGLSVMQVAGWSPVWACGSASNIAKFPVLDGIESLTIFADADQPGMIAARECAARWAAAGCEVRIIPPRRGGDWNDLAREIAA
jgi:hypothetical protein